MRMKYVTQIQSRLKKYKTIHTSRATTRILDGSYNSVYKGRSMNFDELREYVQGDDIKDMDWKASARSQKLLVRQYIAEKKHNIMLVFDTNRKMLADTNSGMEKREVALMSAGTLAFLVNRNGDYISSIFSTRDSIVNFPFRMGLMNIENLLENYHKSVTMDNKSDISKSLDYVLRNIKRKMIIIIVTDMEGISKISDIVLKRLLVRHDILMINISDAEIYGKNVYDIDGETYLPEFFTKDKKLRKIQEKRRQEIYQTGMDKLKKFGIAMVTMENEEDMDTRIIELLEKHKLEHR